MISIKKYLDARFDREPGSQHEPACKEDRKLVLSAAIACCRGSLRAIGKSVGRAPLVPQSDLEQRLAGLETLLADRPSACDLEKVQLEVETRLEAWAERTAEHLKQQTDGVKELLLLLAGTAESVGERDLRYANRFEDLTVELNAIAHLEDLAELQWSLRTKATDLKRCVDQMAEEGKHSLAELRDKVTTYETRLEAVEELALKDCLTGVGNRRSAETRMERWIAQQKTFSILIVDINAFKQVNDSYGHAAGDDLLRKFADELQKNMRLTDLVARWGGDEFVVVLACDRALAEQQLERLRKWVLGKYTIESGTGDKTAAVDVEAAIGLAQWMPGDTSQQVVERADQAMYIDKDRSRSRITLVR